MRETYVLIGGFILIGIMTLGFYFFQGLGEKVYADEGQIESEEIVGVENTICPISGKEVDGKYFVVYSGKSYGACCSMCENKIVKDPGEYIKTSKDE